MAKELDLFEGSYVEGEDGEGWYHFGARYYDADVALWTAPDPSFEVWSVYAAFGSPLLFIDPDGKRKTVYLISWSNKVPEDLAPKVQRELRDQNIRMRVRIRKDIPSRHDRTDAILKMIDAHRAPPVTGYEMTPTSQGFSQVGSQEGYVFVDRTQQFGLLQTIKVTLHELGHALFSFDHKRGTVMGQGRIKNKRELKFSEDQVKSANEFLKGKKE